MMTQQSPETRTMSSPTLPWAKVIHVDTRGAVILEEDSPGVNGGFLMLF